MDFQTVILPSHSECRLYKFEKALRIVLCKELSNQDFIPIVEIIYMIQYLCKTDKKKLGLDFRNCPLLLTDQLKSTE